jgi:hypothetical protein
LAKVIGNDRKSPDVPTPALHRVKETERESGHMIDENRTENERSRAWWVAMFHDVQFWVPLVVLLGGLVLLRAIQ